MGIFVRIAKFYFFGLLCSAFLLALFSRELILSSYEISFDELPLCRHYTIYFSLEFPLKVHDAFCFVCALNTFSE